MLSFLLQLVLGVPLLYGLLWIVYSTGEQFYVWAGVFLTVVVLLFVILIPYVIMPLFNKFEPVEENAVKADIEALAKECAYPLSKVEVVDGSKRSSHSNAFQYGIGSIKKVVIFDTLLEQHLGLTDAATESRRQARKDKKLAAQKEESNKAQNIPEDSNKVNSSE